MTVGSTLPIAHVQEYPQMYFFKILIQTCQALMKKMYCESFVYMSYARPLDWGDKSTT